MIFPREPLPASPSGANPPDSPLLAVGGGAMGLERRAEVVNLTTYRLGKTERPALSGRPSAPLPILPPGVWREPFTGMILAPIPGGTFLMGRHPDEEEALLAAVGAEKFASRFADESPRHPVRLEGFWMGVHAVTQAQWEALGMENRSGFANGGDFPVENVSWHECQEFIRRLNQRTGRKIYRLPTEAEWEYACRAGSETPFPWGASHDDARANVNGRQVFGEGAPGLFRNTTTPVGSFPPNGFGLYDMPGNVWNWCADWHDPVYYRKPRAARGNLPCRRWLSGKRVLRGGAWSHGPAYARSACRDALAPHLRDIDVGLRIVRAG
ncbi:MAG: formylglycine-generating enzyme family protein [Magnetococcales bacterium]|nr:formylglycine-generating enzyme family protein [Magnetococcales bacterium]